MVDAGRAAAWYQDRVFQNLTCKRYRLTRFGASSVRRQERKPEKKRRQAGDIWLWVATDADTKLVPSWHVGGRDSEAAMMFMDDSPRLANRVQLTTDGHKAYLEAVEGAFGGDIDYAMLVKIYGNAPEAYRAATAPQNAPAPARHGSKATPIRRTSARPMPSGTT